jgi:hypothetical protein
MRLAVLLGNAEHSPGLRNCSPQASLSKTPMRTSDNLAIPSFAKPDYSVQDALDFGAR